MPEAATIQLNTLLSDVAGLTAPAVKMLAREGFETVESLLMHFPARHEDRRRMEFKGFAPSESAVCHHVRIVKSKVLHFGRGGVFEATVEGAVDNPMHQHLTLRWFGMKFLQRMLAVDMELIVYGKIKQGKARMTMDHPDYEIVLGGADDDDSVSGIHTGRIVPVYRLRGGLKQKTVRAAMWKVLQAFPADSSPGLLPVPKADGEYAGLSRGAAIAAIHYPSEMANLERARRYLALEEFFILQLRVLRRRRQFAQHGEQPVPRLDIKRRRRLIQDQHLRVMHKRTSDAARLTLRQ